MTIEQSVVDLTTAVGAQTAAVTAQQLTVTNAIATFSATTSRVNALSSVDNTHDTDKPVSTAQATALALKQAVLVAGVNISLINGFDPTSGIPIIVPRGPTTLNSVTYDSRNNLRLTTSSVADDTKVVEGLGIFMFVTTQLEPDDDETCFNAASGQWLLVVPAKDLLDAWSLVEDAIRDEDKEDLPATITAYFTARGL